MRRCRPQPAPTPRKRGGGNSLIVNDSELTKTFDADTSDPQILRFRALEPWTATLEETTRASQPDWIGLSSYGGEAGDVAITITILKENGSENPRYAKITIRSGETTRIGITIEQKGTARGDDPDKPDPDKPLKYVKRIVQRCVDNGSSKSTTSLTQDYTYDAQHRVVRIDETEIETSESSEGGDSAPWLYELEYSADGGVTASISEDGEVMARIQAKLDDAGRVTECSTRELGSDPDGPKFYLSSTSFYTYDTSGRLTRWRRNYTPYDYDSPLSYYMENELAYTDGLFVRLTGFDSQEGQTHDRRFSAEEYYARRYRADRTNIGLASMLIDGAIGCMYDDFSLFMTLGMAGSLGDCLPERTWGGDDSDVAGWAEEGWYEPNVTISRSYTYEESADTGAEDFPLAFTLDDDGCVTRVAWEQPYEVHTVTYDLVVGDELLHPEMAEWPAEQRRYKARRENLKDTVTGSYVNTSTIELEYL